MNATLAVLLRRAEKRGSRDTVVELLTRHPSLIREVAAFVEARKLAGELGRQLGPEAIEVLTLCGVPTDLGR